MKESEWQDQVITLARLTGWRVAHFRAVRQIRGDGSVFYSTPVQADGGGFPDLIMTRGKRMIAAELKVGNNKPTEAQIEWLESLASASVDVYVWRPGDWEEVERELERG